MQSVESEDHETLERRITIFVRNDDGAYRRVDEVHTLRLYSPAVVRDALVTAGFDVEVRAGYDQPADFGGWKVFLAR